MHPLGYQALSQTIIFPILNFQQLPGAFIKRLMATESEVRGHRIHGPVNHMTANVLIKQLAVAKNNIACNKGNLFRNMILPICKLINRFKP